MAPLATRTDLDAPRGSSYIDELLREAFEPSDTQPVKDAKSLAKLEAALADGDTLIRQFLNVGFDWTLISPDDQAQLLPFARDEAIYKLKVGTRAGTDIEDRELANVRRLDLAKMRERGQGPSTATQQPTQSEVVASASRFAFNRLTGLT